jgi:tetratricopeptide (TPR) repeat protein
MYEKDVVSLLRNPLVFFVNAKAYLTVPELARTYRARALLAAGRIDEALAEARAGLAVLPGNIELGLGFVPDLDKAGRKKEADEIYEKIKAAYEAALRDYGNSADLRNSLAWTMVNCNRDLDEALTHAKKAVEVAPKTAGYIDTLAEVYFRRKDRSKALVLMKQCATLEPTNPYFRKQLERFEKKPFDSPLGVRGASAARGPRPDRQRRSGPGTAARRGTASATSSSRRRPCPSGLTTQPGPAAAVGESPGTPARPSTTDPARRGSGSRAAEPGRRQRGPASPPRSRSTP